MAYQWWVAARRAGTDRVHLPGERLPRRHAGRRLGRRDRDVPFALPAAAVRHLAGPRGRCRPPGAAADRARRPGRRGDPRAADPGSRRDADDAERIPRADARALRRARRAADLRRGRDRLRPHRRDVRLRARSRLAGPDVPRQGPDRRVPAAGGDVDDRADLRGLSRPPDELRTFFHGHTFTGNPLGCAAGIATLETFEREQTVQRSLAKIELLTRLLHERVAPLPGVAEIRQCGLMVGIELHPGDAFGHRVTLAARRRGAVIRPLGDVIVLMPAPAMSADGHRPSGRDHRRGDRRGRSRRGCRRRALGGRGRLTGRACGRGAPGGTRRARARPGLRAQSS